MHIFLVSLLALTYITGNAQNIKSDDSTVLFSGRIIDKQNIPVANADFTIYHNEKMVTETVSGRYSFTLLKNSKYKIYISCVGFHAFTDSFITKNENILKDWILIKDSNNLKDVHVKSLSEKDKLKAQPIKANIVETQANKEQPSTLVELINRTSGLHVRQAGTLGTQTQIMLNGFQNRSVRYFKDGIPLDYLGYGFDISLVPVNTLAQMEVYKGVIPLYPGPDALGGVQYYI